MKVRNQSTAALTSIADFARYVRRYFLTVTGNFTERSFATGSFVAGSRVERLSGATEFFSIGNRLQRRENKNFWGVQNRGEVCQAVWAPDPN